MKVWLDLNIQIFIQYWHGGVRSSGQIRDAGDADMSHTQSPDTSQGYYKIFLRLQPGYAIKCVELQQFLEDNDLEKNHFHFSLHIWKLISISMNFEYIDTKSQFLYHSHRSHFQEHLYPSPNSISNSVEWSQVLQN